MSWVHLVCIVLRTVRHCFQPSLSYNFLIAHLEQTGEVAKLKESIEVVYIPMEIGFYKTWYIQIHWN